MIVPQGVRRTGSVLFSPVRTVRALESGLPFSSTTCNEGLVPSAFRPDSTAMNRCVGFSSFGQNAIMSLSAWVALETTDTFNPLATSTERALLAAVQGPAELECSG